MKIHYLSVLATLVILQVAPSSALADVQVAPIPQAPLLTSSGECPDRLKQENHLPDLNHVGGTVGSFCSLALAQSITEQHTGWQQSYDAYAEQKQRADTLNTKLTERDNFWPRKYWWQFMLGALIFGWAFASLTAYIRRKRRYGSSIVGSSGMKTGLPPGLKSGW
jgi:hypothetical protein